jgi:predicted ATPase
MRKAMADAQQIEADLSRPMQLGYLAAAHAGIGEIEISLNLLREAVILVESTDARWFEAELHRLRGEFLLAAGRPVEAESALQHALIVARTQQARIWELRASMCLARHWGDSGRRPEGHDLLAPVYDLFTEGLEARDLREARVLLRDLA